MGTKHTRRRLTLLFAFLPFVWACSGDPGTTDEVETTGGETDPAVTTLVAPEVIPWNPGPFDTVQNALPYDVEYELQADSTRLPAIQSYAYAHPRNGEVLIVGGRRWQGLHTFHPAPAENFPRDSTNHHLFAINFETLQVDSFDVDLLPEDMATALKVSNAQFYYERADSALYFVGGYGWLADGSDMRTFGTVMRIPVNQVMSIIRSGASDAEKAQQIGAAIQLGNDDRLRVTGGELMKLGNDFYLVFGQIFDGQYRPFGAEGFEQRYTEAIKIFRLVPGSVEVLSYAENTNSEAGSPYHRRDLSVVEDVDPDGNPRIVALGGVFPPGLLQGYTEPVYISGPGSGDVTIDTNVNQAFSQYTCPVIVVHDAENRAVYRTFFGGISHNYFHQTQGQHDTFQIASQQGRDDGLPWVADISTMVELGGVQGSTYQQFIALEPIPGYRLMGATVELIENPALIDGGMAMDNGVIRLGSLTPGQRTHIGYVYGGIQSDNPLPGIPNTGTRASNRVWKVYMTRGATAAIPASFAHQAAASPASGTTFESIHETEGNP